MNRFFFNRPEYDRMFNCSMKTPEEWEAIGHKSMFVGCSYITMGVIYESMYIVCMIVMARPEFLKISCYKIMFLIGIYDMANLIISSFLAGYFSLIGAVFCTAPTFEYIVGTGTAAIWVGTCAAGLILAFNRCLEITSTYWTQKLFDGKKTYVWLAFPNLYGLQYWFFQEPGMYSSLGHIWSTDPYYGLDIGNKDYYVPRFLLFNNYTMVVVLTSLYVYLSASIVLKRGLKFGTVITKAQMNTVIQSVLICLLLYLTAIFFTLALWGKLHSPTMIILSEVGWQTSHGGVPIVYLIFNKRMRKYVFEMIVPDCLQGVLKPKQNRSLPTFVLEASRVFRSHVLRRRVAADAYETQEINEENGNQLPTGNGGHSELSKF